MAVHTETIQEGNSGFKKQLESASQDMLFELVQSQQYQFPVPSAIRELVSNAIDSIREKQRFFKIHNGEAKPEDFYIDKDGALFQDSKYKPEYYEEKWLSKTENKVKLIYKVGNNSQRDTFHIIDTGVGLGGLRLEKHFNIGYSSKRLNNQELGKYGYGSKAGLALEVDFYTLITRYNGQEFHFNVYSYKVDPTVPRMNMTTGKPNPYYEMETSLEKVQTADGEIERPRRVYYLPTDKPNGVEVVLQAKKGLRKEFVDGVKSQLLYMDDIDFDIEENGEVIPQQVKAVIEYEDDIFVLPTADSTYYSKPHIILNDVCYGYVNWLQLEEEERAGNIGMKIDPSAIDINPNRESVRWTEKTRKAIHDTFKKGEAIAERLVSELLTSEDLLDWLLKSAAVMGGQDSRSVIGRFANIIDLKTIKPKFGPLPKIRYHSSPATFFTGYDVLLVTPHQTWSKAQQANIPSLKRDIITNWTMFQGRQVFYQDDKTSFRQEMFMFSIYPHGFIKIKPQTAIAKSGAELSQEDVKLLDADLKFEDYLKLSAENQKALSDAQVKKWKQDTELIDKLIQESVLTELYSSITVPEGFSAREKEEEAEQEDVVKEVVEKMSAADQRKLDNRIVVHAFEMSYGNFYRAKIEPKIKEVVSEKEAIIYGFMEDEANLQMAYDLCMPHKAVGEKSWSQDCKIVMISQSNAKFFKHHMYVNDFFMNYNAETQTISMHNKLVKWQTARKIHAVLGQLHFLQNFGLFDAQARIMYNELVSYMNANYTDLSRFGDLTTELSEYADKVTNLQLFIASHPNDPQAIAAMSKALFDPENESTDTFKGAIGIDLEVYEKLTTLLEHTKDVALLLNHVDVLLSSDNIPYNLEREIKEFLDYKGYISISKPTASVPTPPVTELAELKEEDTLIF